MLKLIKFCGYYLLTLTLIYLGMTIYQLQRLKPDDFIGMFQSHMYDMEVYYYSKKIEWMKVVHALCLASIGGFLVHFTRKFKMLNESHYYQMLALTILVTVFLFGSKIVHVQFLNIVLFTLYINAKCDRTAKGIFAVTLVYAIVALLFKFLA